MTTTSANRKSRQKQAPTPVSRKPSGGHPPILKFALALLLLGFFLLTLMLQIQTSEAFFLNGSPVQLAADWGVLNQPLALLSGHLPLEEAQAAMWGWGIELVYLVCVLGEVSVHGRLAGWFKTGAVILVAFNFWTDFNYGNLASGFWGQVAFAGITSFIVAFFGVAGLALIWDAITEFGR